MWKLLQLNLIYFLLLSESSATFNMSRFLPSSRCKVDCDNPEWNLSHFPAYCLLLYKTEVGCQKSNRVPPVTVTTTTTSTTTTTTTPPPPPRPPPAYSFLTNVAPVKTSSSDDLGVAAEAGPFRVSVDTTIPPPRFFFPQLFSSSSSSTAGPIPSFISDMHPSKVSNIFPDSPPNPSTTTTSTPSPSGTVPSTTTTTTTVSTSTTRFPSTVDPSIYMSMTEPTSFMKEDSFTTSTEIASSPSPTLITDDSSVSSTVNDSFSSASSTGNPPASSFTDPNPSTSSSSDPDPTIFSNEDSSLSSAQRESSPSTPEPSLFPSTLSLNSSIFTSTSEPVSSSSPTSTEISSFTKEPSFSETNSSLSVSVAEVTLASEADHSFSYSTEIHPIPILGDLLSSSEVEVLVPSMTTEESSAYESTNLPIDVTTAEDREEAEEMVASNFRYFW